MHACLNVDEIVRLIAHELIASGGRGTAVGLACCCKSFEDPVLDVLWATQTKLLPLLGCFPGEVWNEGGCTVSTPANVLSSLHNNPIRQSFKRLPTATEWARFRKYARRMRELGNRGAPNALSFEVFSTIQGHTINEPFLPNLKSLSLWRIEGPFVPFIPLFFSPRTTSIFLPFKPDHPKAMVASVVTTLPTLCPDLQEIRLSLPRDPIITAAVSGMVLVVNQNVLQVFHVDSPLTEEAKEVVYKLPNLRDLLVIIEGETSLPSVSLPNLTRLTMRCDNEAGWPGFFQEATFGKLESVIFLPESQQIGDFLGAFEHVGLSSSVQNTLSEFCLYTSRSWNPNYSSLLPFTQLVRLVIGFSCNGGCSSRVDDGLVIDLSRAMPQLKDLKLGGDPCQEFTTGVTARGLMALAHHCRNLSSLCVHFQVASLSAPPTSAGRNASAGPTASWTDCALTELVVGEICVPEESVLIVVLTLLQIFPRIETFEGDGEGWSEVEDAICHSRQIADRSSKHHLLTIP